MKKLKPCPFCGSVDDIMIHGGYVSGNVWISCEKCGIETDVFDEDDYGEEYEQAAIDFWNHRAEARDD